MTLYPPTIQSSAECATVDYSGGPGSGGIEPHYHSSPRRLQVSNLHTPC
jgi:hypothetical protein